MVRFFVLILVCLFLPTTTLAIRFVNNYADMDLSELKRHARRGDAMAQYWAARKTKIFAEKAKWFTAYADQRKTSLSSSFLGELYDDKQHHEESYYWYYITYVLCKLEEYDDKWCIIATQRVGELALELPENRVTELKRKARSWIRDR